MLEWIRKPKFFIPGAVAIVALLWLAFGYFGVHLLFVDDSVDEAVPAFAAAAPTDTADNGDPASTGAAGGPTSVDPSPSSSSPPPSTVVPPSAPQIATEFAGTFVSRDHPTSGSALVLGNGTGQRFLRFEGFETDNGPDLNVYLVNSAAGGVDDVIDLGDLKGNVGDQNYEIPSGVDLTVYDTVVIWCVRFSSPFGEAPLVPA
jgi:hypothetical protein